MDIERLPTERMHIEELREQFGLGNEHDHNSTTYIVGGMRAGKRTFLQLLVDYRQLENKFLKEKQKNIELTKKLEDVETIKEQYSSIGRKYKNGLIDIKKTIIQDCKDDCRGFDGCDAEWCISNKIVKKVNEVLDA